MLFALTNYGPAWITPALSVLALTLSVASLGTTLWRGRRRVQLRMKETLKKTDDGILVYYRYQVTNTGYIPLQIDGVLLYPSGGGNGGFPLRLRPGEDPRMLHQGETQEWEIGLHELERRIRVKGRLELVAAATDTTGKEYRQTRKDSLTIDLPDSSTIDLPR
jgi:hypothetical protein